MGSNVYGQHIYYFGKIQIGLKANNEKRNATLVLPTFRTLG